MAGENMTGVRFTFAAVVAFTGKPASGGQMMLIAPEGFRCPTLALPLPVFGWESEGNAVQVGGIEEAYVVDGRVIVFGHLGTGPVARRSADRLVTGTHFLKIDLTHVQTEYLNEPLSESTPDIAGAVHIVCWTLASAFITSFADARPVWDLPPVQIEEMIR
jgi:hypothetical protein